MENKVIIVDYQLGNLFSVKQACEYLGFKAIISSNAGDLLNADFVILPGVGAFADAMNNLHEFGLAEGIRKYTASGKPFMGVCLGLQLLLSESEEFGKTKGLGIIPGVVRKFDVQKIGNNTLKVPQIQWNTIDETSKNIWQHTPLGCCKPGDYMYFVHSLYAEPADQVTILAQTIYGKKKYCSAILHKNVFATQFHPEKSGLHGVDIYREWFNLNRK